MPDITLPNPLLQDHMETTIERKTAAHVMTLWKYKPLDQDNAL
jgi:hypothetical protein